MHDVRMELVRADPVEGSLLPSVHIHRLHEEFHCFNHVRVCVI